MLTKWFYRRGGDDPAVRGRFTRLARVVRARPSTLDPLRTSELPDHGFEATWRQALKRRVLVALACVGLWAVGIEARLVQLQVFEHDELSAKARRHQQQTLEPEALRGDILDRNGELLAYSVEANSLGADPTKVDDAGDTAKAVCAALGDCTAKERQDLAVRLAGDTQFAWIRKSSAVSPEQVARVEALKLPGVFPISATRRYYPRDDLASHVLGFVVDGKGQAGVEYAFDKVIRGEAGLAFAQVDAKRQRLETRVERAPVPGAEVHLTIDTYLQYVAERELKAGVEANHAKGGTALIMNPQTGEILALASFPTFNPNAFGRSTEEQRENRAISDAYEPGSTFKIVTASAALEEGVVKPDELIDTNPGYITIPGRVPIKDTHRNGVITFEDVIVKSSNVGAIKVGLRTGAEWMSRYVHRFGFGQAIAPHFLGASAGIWRPDGLTESGLASVSMGYQVGVTPLQMVTAVSAVANGGLLMEPHLVRAIVKDGRRETIEPKVIRRAIEPETAATLTTFMEGVVQRGTATAAKMEHYGVAGKTGTAAKLVDNHYSKTDYNASFVGFVPSRHPVLSILVVIDTPRAGTYFGGTVSAPIFKRIAEAALQHLGVPPTINPLPPVAVASDAYASLREPARATTLIPALSPVGGETLMPDVRGLSARDALRVLASVGLSPRVRGLGFVAKQAPEPGEAVAPGGLSLVDLERRSDDSGAGAAR